MSAVRSILFAAAGLAAAAGVGAVAVIAMRSAAEPRLVAPYQMQSRALVEKPPPEARWFDTEWGWVVVRSGDDAALVADDIRAAMAAFYRHFGVQPQRGAVVDLEFAGLAPALKQAGAAWVLPWPFRVAGAPGEPGTAGDPRSALRHEIGHALFLALVMPNTRGRQYGGDAPDWLDEATAMLAETPAVLAGRRARFAEAAAAGRVAPLTALIAAAHPLFGAAGLDQVIGDPSRQTGVPRVVKLEADASGISIDRIADFYATSLAVADYLIERSGDERVLARIADIIRRDSKPGWLATLCDRGILPLRPESVDADFAAWASARGSGA
jgi:hypothetical protein